MKDSGLYEASGLKKIFEEDSFWKDIESEKDMFDEPKIEIKKEDEGIDPFWLT